MMNINSWLFLVFFIVLLGSTIYKIYLLMMGVFVNGFEKKNLVLAYVFFILNVFMWGFLLIITMVDTSLITYSVLFNTANLLISLNVLLLIIAHIVAWKTIPNEQRETTYVHNDRFLKRL